MSASSRWLLPAAAGLAMLALGVAALRAGDRARSTEIDATAREEAMAIATEVQTGLLDIAAALAAIPLPADATALSHPALPRGRETTLWQQSNGRLGAVANQDADELLAKQVGRSQRSLEAPVVSANGRDLVLLRVPREGGWIGVTFPADTLVSRRDSSALALQSLELAWAGEDGATGDSIFRASLQPGARSAGIAFPVPGGSWKLLYDSNAAVRGEELRWALYTTVAILAYLFAMLVYRLRLKPAALRGDLDRLNLRFKRLNDELATVLANREQVQDRIYRLSVTDSETGLPNRQALAERLVVAEPVSLVVLGLRDIENAEHTLGHNVVAAILPEIALRLEASLEKSHFIARTNNYQLAVMLPDTDGDAAVEQVSEWTGRHVTGVYDHKFGKLNVSPRFGIVTANDGYGAAERMLDDAMSALSDADASTERWSTFAADRRDDRVTRIQLESDFKEAIANNEFRLFYQPIVNTTSGKPRGFECLVRWQHPVEGLLPPGRFIELGESTGLISELTRWEMREAVRHASTWRNLHRAGCYLSINLSPLDLLQADLVDDFADTVARAGLSASMFRLEITESMLINNVGRTREMLTRFRDHGFGIMMDDFGTGFSSLSYLRQLPFTAVKIDRSFTQAITWDKKDFGLVRNILNLVHFLDMETIIEGIETTEQFELLQTIEPTYCQGYLFSRPLAAIDAEDWLARELGEAPLPQALP